MKNNSFEKLKSDSREWFEKKLKEFALGKLKELNFSYGLAEKTLGLIGKMEKHNRPTYWHMLRVAKVSYMLANKLAHSDGKLEFIGGLLHDIGKLEVDPKSLVQYRDITDEEYEKIKEHTFLGYKNLKDDYALTALVVGGHHGFTDKGYGITEKYYPNFIKQNQKLKYRVINAIRTVAIADFADAARTRRTNERSGGNVPLDDKLKEKFPEDEEKIEYLLKDPEILILYDK